MSIWAELKRRNVFKVAVAYTIIAWIVVQVAETLAPALLLPDWVPTLVVLLLMLGFPVAIFLSWVYDLTPEGIQATDAAAPAGGTPPTRGRRLDFAIIGLLVVALAYMIVDRYVLDDSAPEAQSAPVVDASTAASVAVLPFVSMSGDPEQEYFSDGISEELLNVLAQIPGLKVPSRTSSFTFKGSNTALPAIAAQLGVEHVLEGSVRRNGNSVRITAQLIDVRTDSHLWSETFDREMTDVFAVQDEIAGLVADALEIRLLGDEISAPEGARTDNVEAHEAFLQGVHSTASLRSEDLAASIRYFEQAIELDPEYANAYAGLATAYTISTGFGFIARDEALPAIRRNVERALQLAPNLSEAHLANASLAFFEGSLSLVVDETERAIELNPNFAQAYSVLSSALSALNRPAEAYQAVERSVELDPLNAFINWRMGNARLAFRDFSGARGYYRRSMEIEPSSPAAYAGLGDVDIISGRLDEALRHYLDGIAQDVAQPHMTPVIGFIYLSLGSPEYAAPWLERGADLTLASTALAALYRELVPLVVEGEDNARLFDLLRQLPRTEFGPLGHRFFRKIANATRDREGMESFYRGFWPELFESEQSVTINNYAVAPDVAWLLSQSGNAELARRLVDRAMEFWLDPSLRPIEPPEWATPMIEVEILAMQGHAEEALAAMRRAVDEGWRWGWWQVENDPTLDAIRGTPEFAALMDEVKADVATQLERVEAWRQAGEIQLSPAGL